MVPISNYSQYQLKTRMIAVFWRILPMMGYINPYITKIMHRKSGGKKLSTLKKRYQSINLCRKSSIPIIKTHYICHKFIKVLHLLQTISILKAIIDLQYKTEITGWKF